MRKKRGLRPKVNAKQALQRIEAMAREIRKNPKLAEFKIKENIGIALFSLAEVGVREISIYYSGSGDSGEIVDVNLEYKKNASRETEIDRWDEIEDILREWAYDRLEHEDDWCNNDGGEGTITIQVPSGEYRIHHGVRSMVYNDSEGELKEESFFTD